MRNKKWKTSFWSLIRERTSVPFVWGQHDCALFAIEVIRTVSDRTIDITPSWASEESAAQWIAERGGLTAVVTGYLGEPIPWGSCSMGDIVLTSLPNGEALAVHDGTQLIAPSPNGLRKIPFHFAVCGWKV